MSNFDAAATVTPGWYPDPIGRFELRFYNGSQWTADVANGGERFVDPLGITPPVGPNHTPESETANGLATAAMVLGIIAVTTAWMPFLVVVGLIAGMVAIGLGLGALRAARANGGNRSRAIAGIATGASALLVALLGVMLTIVVLDVYDTYAHPEAHEIDLVSCEQTGSRVTMTGALTNLSERTADFTVEVAFVRTGTRDTRSIGRAELDGVEPGDTATFDVQRQVDLDTIDCEIVEVTGPLPFGLTLD
ncbi:MAG: DUF2510 domain-containing protein [Ilumatobacteraceae bacterium]